MKVEKNMVVALRYVMRNGSGEMLENNLEGEPVEYLHGAGAILPELERQLEGLMEGSRRTVTLAPTAHNEAMEFDILIHSLRMADDDERSKGQPRKTDASPGKECGPDCCC